MRLDEAKQILTNAGYLVEDTSMYSALSDFYRYLKAKAPKKLEIEGVENSITVKFMDNVAKVTLEQFDEDEDPMLYVEAGGDERSFYNEHTDYGPAMQFIIKNICPTNETKQILDDNSYIIENKHFDFWQYKLEVKKIVNKWIKTQKWYKNFDELRSSISWELYIDIVKDKMKDNYEEGWTAEQCAEGIIDLAKEASTK